MRRAAKIALGVLLGLIIAEAAFWLRDGGAFSHVNFYVHDDELGARLEPHASMRLAVGNNPVTTIHTNARGFRGDDWPEPQPMDVLVVGDSQVFGLGVNDDETFSAELARTAKVTVLNAGVPTYGPLEYTALVESLVAERKPRAVVYVLNVANDLFELERKNGDRHAVWDGWAVRKESAPSDVTWFPFRRFFMSRSHLVYAARRLLHTSAQAEIEHASEGTWRDLSEAARETKLPASAPSTDAQRALLLERQALNRELRDLGLRVENRFMTQASRSQDYRQTAKQLAHYDGDPSDILVNRFAEAARPVNSTAAQLLVAALQMDRNDAALRKLAADTKDEELAGLLDKRKALRAKLGVLSGPSATDAPMELPLDRVLLATKTACDRHNTRLLVVALPLDVQVSSAEWTKYGVAPIDLSATSVLLDSIVRRAERLGVSSLDATTALRAAEPGAFLDGDLHMSKTGHTALGRAIADALARPPPQLDVLPAGRSLLPTRAEWVAAAEVNVKGSTAARCETKLIREWLRVHCTGDYEGTSKILPTGVLLVKGGHGDVLLHVTPRDHATLIAPLFEGDDLLARFAWANDGRELSVTWTKGETKPKMAFTDPDAELAASVKGAEPKHLAAKQNEYGEYVDPRCAAGAGSDCRFDSGLNAPACTDDEITFGVLHRCVPRCRPTELCGNLPSQGPQQRRDPSCACVHGKCTPWNGSYGCVEP